MGVVRSAFTGALALATWLWWQRYAVVSASRNLTVVKDKDLHRFQDLVNLGIVGGSTRGDLYYMLQTIYRLKIYAGDDTVVWAKVAASKSNCTTLAPFVQERCRADPTRILQCTVAIYIGPHGIHLSTQYFQCTNGNMVMKIGR
ncbi:hypothetical protein MTO96_039026 [Rhipicephalus appendiculatus]